SRYEIVRDVFADLPMAKPTLAIVVRESFLEILLPTLGIFAVTAFLNWIVYFFGSEKGGNPTQLQERDRSGIFLNVTFLVFLGTAAIYPAFICGCHFHRFAFLTSLPSMVW